MAAEDVLAENRYHILSEYMSILREQYFEASRGDRKALRRLAESENEPHVYRVEALWTLGLLQWRRGDRHVAAENYQEALHLIDTATNHEKKRSRAEETQARLRADGSLMPPQQRFFSSTPVNRPELMARVAVGGQKGDCCKASLEELGEFRLRCCERCKLTFYCSRKCQRKAWQSGHNKACREKMQIEVGDIMQLVGIDSKPEWNGKLVEIVGPDPNAEGRWSSKLLDRISTTNKSIATAKLRHIRPEK
ncbi:expressed unknown protein [Seminavis robusta]|uniref:MYND-type domain-containing protein n=1 Tax=Seminavis robusta TaxID=568900 RepID=A0A9N8E225_9STRA|nr:expressed unknown protein [Seminavis robusta]|eukprot:Sro574_g169130.1 n/a (250) ;mRNA; r:12081-12980